MTLATAVVLGALSVQTIPQDLAAFLQDQLDFSVSDLTELAQGEPVTKRLHADTEREIALVGAMRLPTTTERFVEEFRRMGPLMQGEHTTSIDMFSRNPRADDLDNLTVTVGDLNAIRVCRVGDCDVNLSEAVIGELQRFDESTESYGDQVTPVLRETLLDYVRRYLAEGDSALVVYDHKREPLPLAGGFNHLLSESPYLFEYVPELHRYVEAYPRAQLSNVEDFLYWSVEDFGLRPLTSVTHATIFDRSPHSVPQALIMLKQIYASHYFHASLRVLALVSDSAISDEAGLYLIYLDRSLFDTKVAGIKRHMAERELRQNLGRRLESIRRVFE